MDPLLRKLFIFSILAHFMSSGYAQQFNFKSYSSKNGLGSSSINNIFQDSKGYIWFSTQGGGISRFDGKEFKTYSKTDGLVDNDVTFATEDKNGKIWIGTSMGASQFDGKNFTCYGEKEGLFGGTIYSIYVDDDNKVWFATDGGGVKIFDGSRFTSITKKEGLSSNRVFNITRDSAGNYWFGLKNGIAKYDKKKITTYNKLQNIKGRTFFSAMLDRTGNIWFGSIQGDIIIKSKVDSFTNLILPQEVNNDFIGGMAEDKNGIKWFGTEHGLLRYRDKIFTLYTEKEGISGNAIQAVTCDYENKLWIGTLGAGVNLLSNEAFVKYTEKDFLGVKNVTAIAMDTLRKQFYVGTAGNGLNIFNPSANPKFSRITGIKGMEKMYISAISIDKEGWIWVSTEAGVFVLEKTWSGFHLKKKYQQIDSVGLDKLQTIIHDSKGNTWLGSYGSGLFKISGEKETCYRVQKGFLTDNITTIFEDSKANIWIGTVGKGVIKYDGNAFRYFNRESGFPDNSVWSITEDNKGNMYFGTTENGLCCFNGKTFKTFTTQEGIASNFISVLQWDKVGNCLWLCTEKGMNRLKFKDNFIIESNSLYNEQRGFTPDGINENAICVGMDGLIWLGTTNGLWCYNRHEDFFKAVAPKIRLTGVRLNYQEVDWKKYDDSVDHISNLPVNLLLSYKNNYLVFDVQALSTDNVSYRYKLEGLDTGWSPLTKNNGANFPNIPPGRKYVFRAKAIGSNGVTNSEIVPFAFSISPPWWATWWFRVAVLVIAISSITVFIKGRERVLKAQNVKLEKTVVERTAEVVHQKEIVEEKNKSILIEKERSETLLLNILPAEVAEELKESGHADAKMFDEVTVMFTDFKDFTKIAGTLSPAALVAEIDYCFSSFDKIITKYNIEKIKTIGDSYMCAGGLPIPNLTNACDVVKAALEVREFMEEHKRKYAEEGRLIFEIRIGIHTGPVVAGIVGIKKFAYDIWGDTVNIASRMESSGKAGKVNISESTYQLVKDKFRCGHRGKIDAKNKGMIDMYFVEELISI